MRASGSAPAGRVVSGEPVARPPVVGLCCAVARRVVDKYGNGVAEEQAGGLVEAVVARLACGISGKPTYLVVKRVPYQVLGTMRGWRLPVANQLPDGSYLNPFRTAVPFWGQTTRNLPGLSP